MIAHNRHHPAYGLQKKQRGLAIVEFTIALPLLLFMLFIGAEMGRLLYQYNTLTKSAEDSARFLGRSLRAGYRTGTVSTVLTNAENLVRYGTTQVISTTQPLIPGLQDASNPVTIVTDPADPNSVVVTVTYTYEPLIFPDTLPTELLWRGILLAIPLTASVTMPVL